MKSFLLELSWQQQEAKDGPPVVSIQGALANLRLWGPGDSTLRTAQGAEWFILFAGSAVIRSQATIPLLNPADWLLGRLSAGQPLDGLLLDMEGAFFLIAWRKDWDELLLATDQVGSRTLYYSVGPDRLLCSSHPQRISRAQGGAEIDLQALSLFLGLKSIPAPWSPLQGIKKIRPGWVVGAGRGVFHEVEYWKPLSVLEMPFSSSLKEASEGLVHRLEEAIQTYSAGQRVGIFLSGGLDSTVLAALAKRSGIQLKAFTAGYHPTFRTDETHHAAMVAAYLGIEHQICLLEDSCLLELTMEEVPGFPEPVADPSFWPQVNLARQVRGQVDVVLDGTGADSLLGGSNKFAVKKYANLYRSLPAAMRRGVVAPLSNLLPASRRSRITNWVRLWQIFIRGCEVPEDEQTIYYSRFLQPEVARGLLSGKEQDWPDLSGSLLQEYYHQVQTDRAVAAMGYMTFKAIQPWVELLKLACIEASGGFSVQKPFLFTPVVEYNLALPDAYKVQDGQGKLVLRNAAGGLAPEEILKRKKANFSPPVGRWLSGETRALFFDTFHSTSFFDLRAIKRLFRQQEIGFRDWQSELWALYMWQTWWNALDQRGDEQPDAR